MSTPITVSVRLFASAREIAGCSACDIELPESSTVADLEKALCARFAGLVKIASSLRYAIDEAFVSNDTSLAAGNEVAVIPPVGGG